MEGTVNWDLNLNLCMEAVWKHSMKWTGKAKVDRFMFQGNEKGSWRMQNYSFEDK